MKRRKQTVAIISAIIGIILLILDPKTAASGVKAGMDSCINVIIPSVFPFFLLTGYLNHALMGSSIPGLSVLSGSLQIPKGGDSLLLLGLIGGYPVGAQLIAQSFQNKQLSKRTSDILLGYCSNAGPAFIFGVTGLLFTSPWIPFLLWMIHIFSALLTGYLLPRPEQKSVTLSHSPHTGIVAALRNSVLVCVSVCSWVVTFKLLLEYLHKYLISVISPVGMLLLSGILELSNGCLALSSLECEAWRFILCSTYLAFGGLCVTMQTVSVTHGSGSGLYLSGKIIQTAISFLLSVILAIFIFRTCSYNLPWIITACTICILCIIAASVCAKKRCGNYSENHV